MKKNLGVTMLAGLPAVIAILMSLSAEGCAYDTYACNEKEFEGDLDYEFCCCVVADELYAPIDGAECGSLYQCHDLGYYYPDFGANDAVNKPDYDNASVDEWIACYSLTDGTEDVFYQCDGGGLSATEVCPADLVGVWASDYLVLPEDTSGATCSTVDLQLFFVFGGTGDAGHALGLYGAVGTVDGSTEPMYENLLDPVDGVVYATATEDSEGMGSIEIRTEPTGCEEAELLAVVTYLLTDTDADGAYDEMYVDFSRDPAYAAMEDAGCDAFGFHGITMTLLDPSEPDVSNLIVAAEEMWSDGSATCVGDEVEAFAECEESGTSGPPAPTTSEEFVSRITPRPGDFPIDGHFPSGSYGIAANKWLSVVPGPDNAWITRARGQFDPLFVNSPTMQIVGLLGSGIGDLTTGYVHDEGARVLERLQMDPIRRGAITILAQRWMSANHAGMAAGDLEWAVIRTVASMPDPSGPPIGFPPPPPPHPPGN